MTAVPQTLLRRCNGIRLTVRTRARLGQSLLGLTLATLAQVSAAKAADPDASQQTLQIRPSLSMEIDASDNIRMTAVDPKSDIVFVPQAGLLVTEATSRSKLFVSAKLQYDEFLDEPQLNRLTGNLLAHDALTLVPDFFFLDSSAQISDEFLKLSDQSPTGLPNGSPQQRVMNAQLSPYITANLFGEADATLRAGTSFVHFADIAGTAPSTPLSDSTIYQGSGLLTNGARSRRVEWRLSGDYTFEHRDDGQNFTSADGLAGLTVYATPKLGVVGRVGYEMITDPTIPDIKDVIWSGGLIYKLGETSEISAERRHRFGRDAWYGNLNIALSSLVALTGGYEERFESEQQRLSRSLSDIFSQSGALPALPTPVALGEDLVNQTFFVKDARFGASYHAQGSAVDVSAVLSQRDFTALSTTDETAGITARYTETLPANFSLDFSAAYNALLEARIGEVKTRAYTASGGVIYALSDTADARVTYTWKQTDGLDVISEDLIAASLSKTF